MPCLSPVSSAALNGRARGSVPGSAGTKTRKRTTKPPKPIINLAKESCKGSVMSGLGSKDPGPRKPTLDERIRSLIETALYEDDDDEINVVPNGPANGVVPPRNPNSTNEPILEAKPNGSGSGTKVAMLDSLKKNPEEVRNRNILGGPLPGTRNSCHVRPVSLSTHVQQDAPLIQDAKNVDVGKFNGYPYPKTSPLSADPSTVESPKLCSEASGLPMPADYSLLSKSTPGNTPSASTANTPQRHFPATIEAPPAKRRLFADHKNGTSRSVASPLDSSLKLMQTGNGFLVPDMLSACLQQNGTSVQPGVSFPDEACSQAGMFAGIFANSKPRGFPEADTGSGMSNPMNYSQDVEGLTTFANIACLMLPAKSPSSALAAVTPSRAALPQIGEEAQGVPTKGMGKPSYYINSV